MILSSPDRLAQLLRLQTCSGIPKLERLSISLRVSLSHFPGATEFPEKNAPLGLNVSEQPHALSNASRPQGQGHATNTPLRHLQLGCCKLPFHAALKSRRTLKLNGVKMTTSR